MRKIIIGLLAAGFIGFGLGIGDRWPLTNFGERRAECNAGACWWGTGCRWRRGSGRSGCWCSRATWRSHAWPCHAPLELVKSTPKGELKNPYNADIAAIAEEGHHRYLSAGCNGCHGGGGGGGIGPLLTNDVWVYGPGDDTLFRLIALGTDALHMAGYARVKHEVVVGPMPPFGAIIKSSDDLWRIIAFIRSVNPDSLKSRRALRNDSLLTDGIACGGELRSTADAHR